jgi:hypothetical protein
VRERVALPSATSATSALSDISGMLPRNETIQTAPMLFCALPRRMSDVARASRSRHGRGGGELTGLGYDGPHRRSRKIGAAIFRE